MQHQNDITALLVQQHLASVLPMRHVPLLQFFIKAFENCVEEKKPTISVTAWPYWSNTLGGIQETLSRAVSTYPLVWDTKDLNCFCLNILATNTKLLLLTWTKFLIGLRLQQSMQQRFKPFHCFSDVAAISRNRQALQSQKYSHEASYKLRERWRSVACDLQEQSGNRARFTDLVTFVEKQVKTVCDPLFW